MTSVHSQVLPYCVNKPNWITAIVATNLVPVGVRFVLTYRGDNGRSIESKSYTLAPYALRIFVPGVQGWFSVECESNQPVALRSIYKSKATDEWAADPGVPVDAMVSETDSRNLTAWPKEESPYWRWAGVLELLQVRHCAALYMILKRFWYETGLQTEVQDLNSKTQSARHPEGTHIGTDADFGYFEDPAATWELWEDLLTVFPDAIIMTHMSIWQKMIRHVSDVRRALLNDRILKDDNPLWNHDTHFHLRIALDAAGTKARVNWEGLA